jgi:hypothetical protein
VARDPIGFAAVGKKVTSIGSTPISRTYDIPHSFAEDGVFTRVGISTFDQNFGVAFKSAWRGKLFLGCFVTRVSAPGLFCDKSECTWAVLRQELMHLGVYFAAIRSIHHGRS